MGKPRSDYFTSFYGKYYVDLSITIPLPGLNCYKSPILPEEKKKWCLTLVLNRTLISPPLRSRKHHRREARNNVWAGRCGDMPQRTSGHELAVVTVKSVPLRLPHMTRTSRIHQHCITNGECMSSIPPWHTDSWHLVRAGGDAVPPTYENAGKPN